MLSELIAFWNLIKEYASVFVGTILGLLSPIQPILLLVAAFILADTVAGVWCAKKTGKKITSRKLSTFIGKMLVYSAVVILTYGLDKLLLGEFLLKVVSINLLATKVAAIALIFAEVFSISEKMEMVTGKGLWFHFKRLLNIAKMVKKETKELTDDDDKE